MDTQEDINKDQDLGKKMDFSGGLTGQTAAKRQLQSTKGETVTA